VTSVAVSPAPVAGHERARLPLGTVVLGAAVVTLLRPVSWALGLLGFLAGGGLLLVAWPIVVLPTLTGLQNALGGPVSTLMFGAPSTGLLAVMVGGTLGALVLVLAGVAVGAWAERQGIAVALEAAADDGIRETAPDLRDAPGAWRVAVIRLLALAPVAIVTGLVSRSVYDATYRELILPQDLVTPLPLRVIEDAPGAVAAVLLAWLLADTAASVAVRRLVLERHPVLVAWLLGWADLVRRPQRLLPTALLGVLVLAVVVAPSMLAASIGWDRVRAILADGRDPLLAVAAVLVWVAIWLGGLVLAGVGAAMRAAAWTLELPWSARARAAGHPGDEARAQPSPS
jgi:hypothetical protein